MDELEMSQRPTEENKPSFFRSPSSYSTESERIRKRQRYRRIFEQCDRNGDGVVTARELYKCLKKEHNVAFHVAHDLLEMADKNQDGELTFEEFQTLVENPKIKNIFIGGLSKYVETIVPKRREALLKQISIEEDGDQADLAYEQQYSCSPPPIGLLITAVIIIVPFAIDEIFKPGSSNAASGPLAKWLIYDPTRRYEMWRYFTYMFVHIGYSHLIMNLIVLLLLGIPLEMVHKSWRILLIFFSGVLAGSLLSSLMDPYIKLGGASGGVYAIITAHISTLILNWKETAFAGCQMIFFVLITGLDLSVAIYNRYFEKTFVDEQIGVMAHLAGAIAGICVGIDILRNLEIDQWEIYFKRIALVFFILFIGSTIVLNAVWSEHFPASNYDPIALF